MFIEQFYSEQNQKVSFTRQQASDFAKQVADDFNPIHNLDAKRFCVPGDLLFAIILHKSGLSQHMHFDFCGMVTDGIELTFPQQHVDAAKVVDDNGKEYLKVSANGDYNSCETLIESLIRSYVGFSGHTFPEILNDLMKRNNVMINPTRPMIMYESMEINLKRVDMKDISLRFDAEQTVLNVDGKRGQAKLKFDLLSGDEVVGDGVKYMVLSGLREYDQGVIDQICEDYQQMKADYKVAKV
ncbi:DUF3581 family protein [Thalassotalea sp. Y01]|uniref:DUF3581 family protein n=1 Tax=Thalassotalea sp. Y01 TaxID=2729613 RepID=UPI00145F6C5B|nr:DUF3581 family protein [Thalassotalea sp. Y01]NMP15200.1 DUF3581 domain-containing protein [Thalassotalea sp. Y01]